MEWTESFWNIYIGPHCQPLMYNTAFCADQINVAVISSVSCQSRTLSQLVTA